MSMTPDSMFPTWNAMIAIDVTLVTLALGITVLGIAKRRPISNARAWPGVILVIIGLWIGGSLYAADLYTMTILPSLVGIDEAIRTMQTLHLGYSWGVQLLSGICLAAGIGLTLMQLTRHVERLATAEGEVRSLLNANEADRESLAESEQRFREAERIAKLVHWRTGETMSVWQWVSDNVENLYGVDDKALLGTFEVYSRWIHESDREHVGRTYDSLMAQPRSYTLQYRVIRPDGSLLWLKETGEPVFDDAGTLRYYRGASQDVTDQKRIETELAVAMAKAERASSAKSDFLAKMSHELRTPLNSILGFSEILSGKAGGSFPAGKAVGYADNIHQSARHLLDLINDILDISAIEAGKKSLEIEDVDVGGIIDECARLLEPTAQVRGVSLRVNAADAEARAWIDARAFRQVVFNLVSNALKFTEPGGDVVIRSDRDGTWVRLRVTDTGVGIPEHKLHEVTEPFTQVHGDPHVAQGGSGLGLAIANALVEEQGGRMLISSRLGEGTTVVVTVPAAVGRLKSAVP